MSAMPPGNGIDRNAAAMDMAVSGLVEPAIVAAKDLVKRHELEASHTWEIARTIVSVILDVLEHSDPPELEEEDPTMEAWTAPRG